VSPKNKPFKVALDPDVSKKSQVAKNLVSSSVSKNSEAANAFDSLGSKVYFVCLFVVVGKGMIQIAPLPFFGYRTVDFTYNRTRYSYSISRSGY
jgi:hypothetical protein